jgi:hypothetical protein
MIVTFSWKAATLYISVRVISQILLHPHGQFDNRGLFLIAKNYNMVFKKMLFKPGHSMVLDAINEFHKDMNREFKKLAGRIDHLEKAIKDMLLQITYLQVSFTLLQLVIYVSKTSYSILI